MHNEQPGKLLGHQSSRQKLTALNLSIWRLHAFEINFSNQWPSSAAFFCAACLNPSS